MKTNEMINGENHDDLRLIKEALEGNKASLEKLIKVHQDFIYNVAFRLYLTPDDALDATQEVLIKVITHLKTFNGQSKFRTWLYRIVVNHFLNEPKRKYEELSLRQFESFSNDDVSQVGEQETEEVRIMCSFAMLMCLNREQRLIYIIGEIFSADHNMGAALFDISPANYRVKLHRAKTDLLNYVSNRCGLVNPDNSCRCPKKTRQLIREGLVDKDKLIFNRHFTEKIADIISESREMVSDDVQLKMKELFVDSPYQVRDELDALLTKIVE